jgi:type I restriction enzyme S subunit
MRVDEGGVVPLSTVLRRVRRVVPVEPGKAYRAVSVTKDGQGLGAKEPFVGGVTRYTTLLTVHAGDVVLRTITAFESPAGVAQARHHGAHVSPSVFVTYEVDEQAVLPAWLGLFFQTPAFWQQMQAKATGTVLRRKTVSSEVFLSVLIPLPELDVQRRIVDLMAAADVLGAALEREAVGVSTLYQQHLATVLTSSQQSTLLSTCMSLDSRREKTDAHAEYKSAGVLRSGLGMIDRGAAQGSATAYATVIRLRADQLIMRKLTAWEGPITVVPADFAGFVVSPEFPTFNLDRSRLLPDFMRHVCRWPGLWIEMKQRIAGSVQRRQRLSPEQLLSIALRLPLVAEQQAILPVLDSLYEVCTRLQGEAVALQSVRASLLPALLSGHLQVPESYDQLVGAL